MTGAEALIKAAGESGITLCFANTGTTEIPLVAALDSVGGIGPCPAFSRASARVQPTGTAA